MNILNSLKRFSLTAADAATNSGYVDNYAWGQLLSQKTLGEDTVYASSSNSPQPHSPSVPLTDGDNTEDAIRKGYDRGSDMGNDIGNNSCEQIIVKLSAFQDGELDHEEFRRVTLHLGKCSRCAGIFAMIQETDEILEREWRNSAPLPSSLRYTQSIDTIMDSLPLLPDIDVVLASRRPLRHSPSFDRPSKST